MARCIYCKKENEYQDEGFVCYECKISGKIVCLKLKDCGNLPKDRPWLDFSVEIYNKASIKERLQHCKNCGHTMGAHHFKSGSCLTNDWKDQKEPLGPYWKPKT